MYEHMVITKYMYSFQKCQVREADIVGRYQAVIFDLDGVICSTDIYHYDAWKRTAEQMGLTLTKSKYNRLRGVSRARGLEIVLEEYTGTLTDGEKEALAHEKNRQYRSLLTKMTPADVPPEVKAAVAALRKHGTKLAIGSSSRNALYILERVGMNDAFDVVIDGSQLTHAKPHPEVFLKAAHALGVAVRQCLVVEDAVSGIEAAASGGFDSAGIGDAADCPLTTYRIAHVGEVAALVLNESS